MNFCDSPQKYVTFGDVAERIFQFKQSKSIHNLTLTNFAMLHSDTNLNSDSDANLALLLYNKMDNHRCLFDHR